MVKYKNVTLVSIYAILNTLVTSLYIFITPEEGLC